MKQIAKLLIALCVIFSPMKAFAEEFFPPEYKTFAFKEGDLLVSRRSDGKCAVNKILKVDRVVVKKGESISIQGRRFTAPVEDYLLVVSASYGADEFGSFEEARAAALKGKWTVHLGHVPNRAPGAEEGQVRVGSAPVEEAELTGYRAWKTAFEKGEAGIF